MGIRASVPCRPSGAPLKGHTSRGQGGCGICPQTLSPCGWGLPREGAVLWSLSLFLEWSELLWAGLQEVLAVVSVPCQKLSPAPVGELRWGYGLVHLYALQLWDKLRAVRIYPTRLSRDRWELGVWFAPCDESVLPSSGLHLCLLFVSQIVCILCGWPWVLQSVHLGLFVHLRGPRPPWFSGREQWRIGIPSRDPRVEEHQPWDTCGNVLTHLQADHPWSTLSLHDTEPFLIFLKQ